MLVFAGACMSLYVKLLQKIDRKILVPDNALRRLLKGVESISEVILSNCQSDHFSFCLHERAHTTRGDDACVR